MEYPEESGRISGTPASLQRQESRKFSLETPMSPEELESETSDETQKTPQRRKSAWSDTEKEARDDKDKDGLTFHDFINNTTFHGIKYIFEGTGLYRLRRWIWLFSVIGAIAFFVIQVSLRITVFFKYESNINMDVKYPDTLPMPSVTICNQNTFRLTAVARENMYNNTSDFFGHNDVNLNLNDGSGFIQKAAHQRENLLSRCTWKNRRCLKDDFIEKQTDLGQCYTFQPKDSRIDQTGVKNGLNLLLNLEQYEYMVGPQMDAGIKVMLHDRDESPLMNDLGLALAPGTHSLLGIKRGRYEYLGGNYGSCSQDNMPLSNCTLDCWKKKALTLYNCTLDFLEQTLNASSTPCDLNSTLHLLVNDDYKTMQGCNCLTPCKRDLYEASLSFSLLSDLHITKIMSADDEDSKDGDTKGNQLRNQFLRAREVSQRVIPQRVAVDEVLYYNTYRATQHLYGLVLELNEILNGKYDGLVDLNELDYNFYKYDQVKLIQDLQNRFKEATQPKLFLCEMFLLQETMSKNFFHYQARQKSSELSDELQWCQKGDAKSKKSLKSKMTAFYQKECPPKRKKEIKPLNSDIIYSKCIIGNMEQMTLQIDKIKCDYENKYSAEPTPDPCDLLVEMLEEKAKFLLQLSLNNWNDSLNYSNHISSYIKENKKTVLSLFNQTGKDPYSQASSRQSTCEISLQTLEDFNKETIDKMVALLEKFTTMGTYSWQELLDSVNELLGYELLMVSRSFMDKIIEAYQACLWISESMAQLSATKTFNLLRWDRVQGITIEPLENSLDYLNSLEILKGKKDITVFLDILNSTLLPKLEYLMIYLQKEPDKYLTKLQLVEIIKRLLLPVNYMAKILQSKKNIDHFLNDLRKVHIESYERKIDFVEDLGLISPLPGFTDNVMADLNLTTAILKFSENVKFADIVPSKNENFVSTLLSAIEEMHSSYWSKMTSIENKLSLVSTWVLGNFSQVKDQLTNYEASCQINENFIKTNFLELSIFYRVMSYDLVEQQVAFSFASLLGEIGGFLGLLLGASILTVCELVDFLVVFFIGNFSNKKNKTQPE